MIGIFRDRSVYFFSFLCCAVLCCAVVLIVRVSLGPVGVCRKEQKRRINRFLIAQYILQKQNFPTVLFQFMFHLQFSHPSHAESESLETSDPPCKPKKTSSHLPRDGKKNSRQFEIDLQIDGWHLILALSGGGERRKEDSPCQIGSGNFGLLEDVTGGRCTTIEMRGGPYWW